MLAMCTSSGPSASRSILAQLNICASSVSCDRPFAPWTWKNHEYLISYSFEIHAYYQTSFYQIHKPLWRCTLGLGNSTTVIYCHDICSTIMMMIVLFYYCDSSSHDIWMIFIDYTVYFMQPMFNLHEHCNPDRFLAHYSTISFLVYWVEFVALHKHCSSCLWPTHNFNDSQYYHDSE